MDRSQLTTPTVAGVALLDSGGSCPHNLPLRSCSPTYDKVNHFVTAKLHLHILGIPVTNGWTTDGCLGAGLESTKQRIIPSQVCREHRPVNFRRTFVRESNVNCHVSGIRMPRIEHNNVCTRYWDTSTTSTSMVPVLCNVINLSGSLSSTVPWSHLTCMIGVVVYIAKPMVQLVHSSFHRETETSTAVLASSG
jgi:hypothetical protein